MTAIIKSKASSDEIIRLQQEKTNKTDTEGVIRNMDTLHKMLTNVVTILTELAR